MAQPLNRMQLGATPCRRSAIVSGQDIRCDTLPHRLLFAWMQVPRVTEIKDHHQMCGGILMTGTQLCLTQVWPERRIRCLPAGQLYHVKGQIRAPPGRTPPAEQLFHHTAVALGQFLIHGIGLSIRADHATYGKSGKRCDQLLEEAMAIKALAACNSGLKAGGRGTSTVALPHCREAWASRQRCNSAECRSITCLFSRNSRLYFRISRSLRAAPSGIHCWIGDPPRLTCINPTGTAKSACRACPKK